MGVMKRMFHRRFLGVRLDPAGKRAEPPSRPRPCRETGFTLTELLVAMVLAGVAMSAIYAAYVTQQRAYKTTQDVTAAQQNLRSAMYFLEKDLRMAGYDPQEGGSFGFTNTLDHSFKFTWDEDEDGVLTGSSEYVSYKFETPETTLERDSGDGYYNDIADSISGVTFTYFTASGVTTTTPGQVRMVLIDMTAERGAHERTLQSRIWCRNTGL